MTNEMKIASIYSRFSGDLTPTREEMYQYLQIANNFGSAAATASIIENGPFGQLLFGEGLSIEDKVISVFNGLFGRAPLEDGLIYWVNQLENNSSYVNETSMAEAILRGAEANVNQTDWLFVESYSSLLAEGLEGFENNQKPVANAGFDQTVDINESIKLDASLSYDIDGEIVDFLWTMDNVTLSTEESFTFSSSEVGEHAIILTVTDDNNDVDMDEVIINVGSGGIGYSLNNGLLTNTGNTEIVLTDLGINASGILTYQGETISFVMEGTVEQGFDVTRNGLNEHVNGYNFTDLIINEDESFYLNDFLPSTSFESIPGIEGTMNMELTLITTVGNFTDETISYL